MSTQTTYSERIAAPSPGTVHGTDNDTITGLCETASPGIPFGRAVSKGTLSDNGVIIGGAIATFRGISTRDITLGAEHDAYLPPNNVGIVRRGSIWAEPAVAVAVNDPVHFSATTGILTNTGGVGPIKGAYWVTSCGVGGRAIAYIPGYERNT
jgi:hypothetical protein